jgi:hypothetical protein
MRSIAMTSSEGLKNTPLKKRSKKAQRAHHALKRADWNGVMPVTRVVPDKTKYNRNRMKRGSND